MNHRLSNIYISFVVLHAHNNWMSCGGRAVYVRTCASDAKRMRARKGFGGRGMGGGKKGVTS